MNLDKGIFLPGAWSDADQALHGALWSAFVGLMTDYDVRRFNRRYRPTKIPDIAGLVCAQLGGATSDDKSTAPPAIPHSILKLALWTLVPHLPKLDEATAAVLRRVFFDQFHYEAAAVPTDGPDRPVLPELRELGIERPTLVTRAFRASVHVRLEAVVTRSLDSLRQLVYPWNWELCPFWTELPKRETSESNVLPTSCKAAVRLPGGDWIMQKPWHKERPVQLDLEVTHSPFATRLDYYGIETGDVAERTAPEEQCQQAVAPEPDDGRRRGRYRRKPPEFELRPFRGYWLIEKMPGRPGVSRIVAEREAAFEDVNHGFFCKETLWYWLASELVAFVAAREEPKT